MRIKHLNMINMNINMNMMKEAIDVLINSEKHILIIGGKWNWKINTFNRIANQ
ncbi:Uncharacterised protein [Escherichia coli]|nr:Uncharacterised protein [Escherichia coli]